MDIVCIGNGYNSYQISGAIVYNEVRWKLSGQEPYRTVTGYQVQLYKYNEIRWKLRESESDILPFTGYPVQLCTMKSGRNCLDRSRIEQLSDIRYNCVQ